MDNTNQPNPNPNPDQDSGVLVFIGVQVCLLCQAKQFLMLRQVDEYEGMTPADCEEESKTLSKYRGCQVCSDSFEAESKAAMAEHAAGQGPLRNVATAKGVCYTVATMPMKVPTDLTTSLSYGDVFTDVAASAAIDSVLRQSKVRSEKFLKGLPRR